MQLPKISTVKPYVYIFLILFFVFNVLLSAVYSIKSQKLEGNVIQSLRILEKENKYLNLFPFVSENIYKCQAFAFENYIDKVMIDKMVPHDMSLNPWQAALDMNHYSRYWHGYCVIMRPLMIIFNYSQLRLLNIFLLTACTVVAAILLARALSNQVSLAFLAAVIAVKSFIVPFCLSLSLMFYVFFVFLFIFIFMGKYINNPICESKYFSYYIFLLGGATSFIDLLTTPLLPVGMLIAIGCIWDYEKYSILTRPWKIIQFFFIWATGYVGIWLAKWMVATIILEKNIIYDAIKTVYFRVHGEVPKLNLKVDSFLALKHNLWCVISPFDAAQSLLITLLFVLTLIFLLQKGLRSININFYKDYRLYWTLLLIGCTPFLWTLVIANHSQIHGWFTYRIYCITIFIILYIFLKNINSSSRKAVG
ncbi:MAG: hypothetical protein HDQ89_11520 [Desulfovibrio sp.]|nr:hypothetical protein [Desulfovibrio sp.]